VKRRWRKTGFFAQGSLGVLNRFLSGFRPDGFVLALIGTRRGRDPLTVSGHGCRDFGLDRLRRFWLSDAAPASPIRPADDWLPISVLESKS
jgi:hypothetical protein